MKLKLFFILFVLLSSTVQAKIKGSYEKLKNPEASPIPKENSLKVVHLTEIFSFTCPHCYHFNKKTVALKKKYGKRLVIESKPIGWSGENPGRLFYIAEEKGIGEKVKNFIFNAVFESGIRNINDIKVLSFIAEHFHLKKHFQDKVNSIPIISKMNASMSYAKKYNIDATPSIVIENSIRSTGDTKNLIKIIDSLLKK